MVPTRPACKYLLVSLAVIVLQGCCKDAPTAVVDNPLVDLALNGSWVDGVQSGPVKVYVTELRFSSGSFEWTFDGDLQQRGEYDTREGILTVTIHNNYGSPLRLLGDYSRPYSVVGSTLNWGGGAVYQEISALTSSVP